ncbi:hypothetical protein [Flavobacterium sp. GP15]|uniref:hypothetical protein n=1 Tax=Flavobacterium sp. GP15 TaxID=2758567 RepID=UPI00165DCB91|nr:hypothetical protein [Flavobacterium sp. GP15]
MVAFSGVAMANNNEVAKLKISVKNEMLLVKATPCQDMAIDIYEYVVDTYNCGEDDIDLLNALMSNC